MQIQAMVVRAAGGPFRSETLELDEPRDDEVLVRILASGMCHTDLAVQNQDAHYPLPCVLGHEGAGIVERVGSRVSHVAPGDHVVLSFASCGRCRSCQSGRVAHCSSFVELNLTGTRADSSVTLRDGNADIHGSFFSQSSFATHAIALASNVVQVPRAAPLELLGPLGCGVQTGVGSVLNVLRPPQGTSIAVFGAGAVGLSAVMAARVVGCAPIYVIDTVKSRLELARQLGATRTIDATCEEPLTTLRGAGGVDYALDTSGVPACIEAAVTSLRRGGSCALVSSGKHEAVVSLPVKQLTGGRTLYGVIEGDANPRTFIPYLIDLYMKGQLPFDRLIQFYPLVEINQAAADSQSGAVVKPVLRVAAPTGGARDY